MGEFPSFDYHILSGVRIIDNVGLWTEVLGKNTPIAQDLPSQQNYNTICFFSKVDRAFDNAFDRVVEQMHLDSTDGTQAFTAQTSTANTCCPELRVPASTGMLSHHPCPRLLGTIAG
jgi:hypothetical protein